MTEARARKLADTLNSKAAFGFSYWACGAYGEWLVIEDYQGRRNRYIRGE